MRIFSQFLLYFTLLGAINWALWGFFQFDLIAYFVGSNVSVPARTIYAVIGVSGILYFLGFKR